MSDLVCPCPVLSTFIVNWNDGLPTDADRERLLQPLMPSLVGASAGEIVQHRRAYMVLDWMLRVQAPTFFELDPAYASYAQSLRDLPEVVDLKSASAAEPILLSASAAMEAAEERQNAARIDSDEDLAGKDGADGAGDAVLEAAKAAAWDAALETAWLTPGKIEVYTLADTDIEERPRNNPVQASSVQTAWFILVTAAGNATSGAGRTAGRNAPEAAARAPYKLDVQPTLWEAGRIAGWKVLAPTVERLQASAVDLVRRMIDVRSSPGP